MKKWNKAGVSVILTIVLTLGLSACGSSSTAGETKQNTGGAEVQETTSEVQKIVIATSGSPAPYLYTDDNGNLDGFDIAAMNEIFSRLPQYEVEYELTEFASIFTGLDAGYYQVGLNHMGYTKERGEKYIYSDLYGLDAYGILLREDNDDIQTVDDFVGHSTEITAASKNAMIFESFNEENPDKAIELQYTDDANTTPGKVADGSIDFEFFQIITLKAQIEAGGLTGVKIIPVSNEEAQTLTKGPIGNFVLFPKGDEQLAGDFNQALREAVEDGSIQKLRKEYLDVEDNDVLTIDDVNAAREFIDHDLASE